jgi:hypothetical protein
MVRSTHLRIAIHLLSHRIERTDTNDLIVFVSFQNQNFRHASTFLEFVFQAPSVQWMRTLQPDLDAGSKLAEGTLELK